MGATRRADHRVPPAPEPQARALSFGRMLTGGGSLGLVALLATAQRDVPWVALSAFCLLSVVGGLLCLRFGPRLPSAAFHVMLVCGWLIVGTSVHLVGGGSAGMAMGVLAVWAALYAGLFFTPVATALHTTGAVAVIAAGMAGQGQPWVFEMIWLAGVSGMVAGVTNWMSYRRARSRLDPLTGLPSHLGLSDVLEARMRDFRELGRPLTLGVLDLDDFRGVNRADGTGAGDQLLRDCVERWQRALPADGVLARRGSDEFAAVLPGHGLAEGREVIERLRASLGGSVTCSAGVTTCAADDTQSLLLARADTALYAAKMGGRDRTEVAGEDSEWLAELERALANEEIVVHYQPLHAVDDGRLVAVEALVRWDHPERGLLSPAAFLPTAEAGGAIHELGRRVLDLACGHIRDWRERYPQHARLRVSVNLSTVQLGHPQLLTDVEQALDRYGLDPEALFLEITEGALADDDAETVAVLWELKDRGIRLAIDDFGTGHSSLSRLRSLPFDVIKVDRSFVQPLGSGDASADALFSVIVRMGESLGMVTVAEGIETELEREAVARHGAAYLQGYLLSRPVPAEEIERRLAASVGSDPLREGGHLDQHATGVSAASAVLAAETRPAAFRLAPADRRMLRSLLAHVIAATGYEVAYVTRVDLGAGEQHVLVAHHGDDHVLRVEEGARVDWKASICRHALLDLDGDDRMGGAQAELTSPLVAGGTVRAFLTAPINLADGTLFGTVCVISSEARDVEDRTTQLLAFVARLVADQLEASTRSAPHPEPGVQAR